MQAAFALAKNPDVTPAELVAAELSQADLLATDALGQCSVHHACISGNTTFLGHAAGLLGSAAGAAFAQKDRNLRTPLHLAVWNGRVDAVIFLLDQAPAALNAREKGGYTPLFFAVYRNDVACAKILIGRGASVGLPSRPVESAVFPLHQACILGNLAMVGLLLGVRSHEEPVLTWPLPQGLRQNPLVATRLCRDAKRALANEQDLDADLLPAVPTHRSHCATLFLDAPDKNRNTPLHLAVRNRRPEVAVALLRIGAYPVSTLSCGSTPLHMAVNAGAVELVMAILAHAPAHAWDFVNPVTGLTPLDLARANGTPCVTIVRLLEEKVGRREEDDEQISCPICYCVLYLPATLACGHVMCTRCAMAALQPDGLCPFRCSVRHEGPIVPDKQRIAAMTADHPTAVQKRNVTYYKQRALDLLAEFSASPLYRHTAPARSNLAFDEANSCEFRLNDRTFKITLLRQQLIVYHTLATGLPQDPQHRAVALEALLAGAFLGSQFANGGVAVLNNGSVVLSLSVQLPLAKNTALCEAVNVFSAMVEGWARRWRLIVDGQDLEAVQRCPVTSNAPAPGLMAERRADLDKANRAVAELELVLSAQERSAMRKYGANSWVMKTARANISIVYHGGSDLLYLHAPVWNGVPHAPEKRAAVFERLITMGLPFTDLPGAGIGVDVNGDVIMAHACISLGCQPETILASVYQRFADAVSRAAGTCNTALRNARIVSKGDSDPSVTCLRQSAVGAWADLARNPAVHGISEADAGGSSLLSQWLALVTDVLAWQEDQVAVTRGLRVAVVLTPEDMADDAAGEQSATVRNALFACGFFTINLRGRAATLRTALLALGATWALATTRRVCSVHVYASGQRMACGNGLPGAVLRAHAEALVAEGRVASVQVVIDPGLAPQPCSLSPGDEARLLLAALPWFRPVSDAGAAPPVGVWSATAAAGAPVWSSLYPALLSHHATKEHRFPAGAVWEQATAAKGPRGPAFAEKGAFGIGVKKIPGSTCPLVETHAMSSSLAAVMEIVGQLQPAVSIWAHPETLTRRVFSDDPANEGMPLANRWRIEPGSVRWGRVAAIRGGVMHGLAVGHLLSAVSLLNGREVGSARVLRVSAAHSLVETDFPIGADAEVELYDAWQGCPCDPRLPVAVPCNGGASDWVGSRARLRVLEKEGLDDAVAVLLPSGTENPCRRRPDSGVVAHMSGSEPELAGALVARLRARGPGVGVDEEAGLPAVRAVCGSVLRTALCDPVLRLATDHLRTYHAGPVANLLIDPFTDRVRVNPVVTEDGTAVEQACAILWSLHHATTPLLGLPCAGVGVGVCAGLDWQPRPPALDLEQLRDALLGPDLTQAVRSVVLEPFAPPRPVSRSPCCAGLGATLRSLERQAEDGRPAGAPTVADQLGWVELAFGLVGPALWRARRWLHQAETTAPVTPRAVWEEPLRPEWATLGLPGAAVGPDVLERYRSVAGLIVAGLARTDPVKDPVRPEERAVWRLCIAYNGADTSRAAEIVADCQAFLARDRPAGTGRFLGGADRFGPTLRSQRRRHARFLARSRAMVSDIRRAFVGGAEAEAVFMELAATHPDPISAVHAILSRGIQGLSLTSLDTPALDGSGSAGLPRGTPPDLTDAQLLVRTEALTGQDVGGHGWQRLCGPLCGAPALLDRLAETRRLLRLAPTPESLLASVRCLVVQERGEVVVGTWFLGEQGGPTQAWLGEVAVGDTVRMVPVLDEGATGHKAFLTLFNATPDLGVSLLDRTPLQLQPRSVTTFQGSGAVIEPTEGALHWTTDTTEHDGLTGLVLNDQSVEHMKLLVCDHSLCPLRLALHGFEDAPRDAGTEVRWAAFTASFCMKRPEH